MIESALENLFQQYLTAFKYYDLTKLKQCYQLPCVLHTPDKVAYLADDRAFEQEFLAIFTMLQQAKVSDINMTKATYSKSVNNAVDVCISWVFIDENGEVFADFCAFYHITKIVEEFKIMSVVSHELSNSIALAENITAQLSKLK
ncbi:hypothetical protein [Thalassotalea sp. SU-HH00458]|uniref:hypothetical protein n=1 Tax=Thalassotalea sp. SU-HH00458 TaxID=3127657 RepID=UPI003109AC16